MQNKTTNDISINVNNLHLHITSDQAVTATTKSKSFNTSSSTLYSEHHFCIFIDQR